MRTNLQLNRALSWRLPKAEAKRLVVLTGARQTGKTTLARSEYPRLRYINLDAPENREAVRLIRTANWGQAVGPSILDEAQKEPVVFDKIKWAFDEKQINFSILLGSSQILMMKRIRESLAGRAFILELFPLMASELLPATGGKKNLSSIADLVITGGEKLGSVVRSLPTRLLPQEEEPAKSVIEHLFMWGGMPALLPLDDQDRREWLRSYQYTYLERDLGDLARLDDLQPFRQFQKISSLRSGQVLSYSNLARESAISVSTARRYMEYLRISYQAIFVPPFFRNLTSVVVKTPKLYWLDVGLMRQQSGYWGEIGGHILETLVVAEIYKLIKTSGKDVGLYFYRTRSGMEVDLIIQTPAGVTGIEVKAARNVSSSDARGLGAVAEVLKDEWCGGIILFCGSEIIKLAKNDIWAIPIHRFFMSAP